MKTIWMMLSLIMVFGVSQASAADMHLKLNIPEVNVENLQGNGQAVALWVEDSRNDPSLGVNLQGDKVVLRNDAAAAVMASFTSALRTAGFRIEPYRADAPVAILIRIQSLSYASKKNMMTSTAKLGCKIQATLSRDGVMVKERDLDTSGEHTLAWRPNKTEIAELVSETLHDAVLAMLQDTDTTDFLKTGQ